MKQCPKCQRTYADDNQKFCTVDGGRLESAAANAETTYDLSPTVITNQADLNVPPGEPAPDLNKTMAALPPPPTGEIRSNDTGPATNRTIAASFQPADFSSPQPPAQQPQQQPSRPAPPQQQDYRQPQPPYQGQRQQPPAYQPQQQQYQQQHYQQQQQSHQPQQHSPAPSPQQSAHTPQAGAHAAATAPRKGSRLPLILGALALLLLVGGGAAYYFLVLNKKDSSTANANSNANVAGANANANMNSSANANSNANTTANANVAAAAPPFEPPPNTTQFVNSSAKLDGKLAEHFIPFSFYYPDAWELDPKSGVAGASNFVVVERKLPPDFTQERFAVGWYESNGTYDADKSLFQNLVQASSARLEKLPGYQKLSEGETKVNSMNAYEFRFSGLSEETEKGDITYWGRIIFLPPGVEGNKNGLTLTILTSSLAPELEGIDDVGTKGELPVILESFRLK